MELTFEKFAAVDAVGALAAPNDIRVQVCW